MNIYTFNTTSSLNEVFGLETNLIPELSDQYFDSELEEARKYREYTPDMHPWYGKKHTEEWRRNHSRLMSENHPMKGRKHTEEARAKISKAGIGRYCSPETRKKMSERKLGVKKSKKQINNMISAHGWKCISPEGTVYDSCQDAARKTGIPKTTLHRWINKGSNDWKWLDNERNNNHPTQG